MKNLKMKKIVAIISAVAMMVTSVIAMQMTAFADDVAYSFDEATGVLTITGTGEMESYNESNLESIPWYADRADITSIVVGEGITSIGDYAFCREANLVDVQLPSTLTAIGSAAFAGDSSLLSLTIPDSVTTVGDYAFGYAYDMSLTEGFVAICGKNSAAQQYCIKSYVPFDVPFDASGNDTAVVLGSNWQTMWSIAPKATGTVTFWSTGTQDTFGLIYDASNYVYNSSFFAMQKSAIVTGDDTGSDCNFSITQKLEGGKRYYLAAKYMSASKTSGSFAVHMTFTCDEHEYELLSDTATCTQDGIKAFKCIGCGVEYTEPSDMKEHTPGEVVEENRKDATCVELGSYDEVVYCTVCNAEISRNAVELDYVDHNYVAKTVIDPTCTEGGYTLYECTVCEDTYFDDFTGTIEHTPGEAKVEDSVDPTCSEDGSYNLVVRCTVCDGILDSTTHIIDKLGHSYVHSTVQPTCTKDGAEVDTCENCGDVISEPIPATGHSYTAIDFADGEVGVVCDNCDKYKTVKFMDYLNGQNNLLDIVEDGIVNAKDYAKFRREFPAPDVICEIDLTAGSLSRANAVLEDGVLTLTPSGRYSFFTITGDATGIQIVVNAANDAEIKLVNANISVDSANAITLNNTATDGTIPVVSISATEGTSNSITTTTTGNAISNYADAGSCKLELKGHGTLTLNTASTAINSGGKIEVKNITLDITTGNRGIDTKFTNAEGLEDYASMDVEGNANITINAVDDGIRCKNFETKALGAGDVDTVINITAGGDGIQMEGKKSAFNSGNITINAKGYAFNCASANFKINAAATTINATGKKGFSKP